MCEPKGVRPLMFESSPKSGCKACESLQNCSVSSSIGDCANGSKGINFPLVASFQNRKEWLTFGVILKGHSGAHDSKPKLTTHVPFRMVWTAIGFRWFIDRPESAHINLYLIWVISNYVRRCQVSEFGGSIIKVQLSHVNR